MKIYKENEKHWVMKLEQDDRFTHLLAVDARTGKSIACLLEFDRDGEVHPIKFAFVALQGQGYDPYEHNNKYDLAGALIIGEPSR